MGIRQSNAASIEQSRANYEQPETPAFAKAPPAALPMHAQLWADVKGELALVLTAGAFLDWVWPLASVALEDNVLRVACPDGRRLEIVTYRKPLFLRIMRSLGMEGLQLEFESAPPRNNNRGH